MHALNRMETFDEGLGTAYERFMLNDFFNGLMDSHTISNILEVPIYGMTGLTGINSVHFAKRGRKVILVDTKKDNTQEAAKLWDSIPLDDGYEILCHKDLTRLPFSDNTFDLVWNFAAIWHVKDAGLLLNEMARVSSNLVLIFVPNKKQIGYPLRKYIIDREFFNTIDESWIDLEKISAQLESQGMKAVDEGLMDIPIWPDTAMPVKALFKKDKGNGKKPGDSKSGGFWSWDIMSYYKGDNPGLKDKIEKFSFLEKMPVPKQLKAFWAHHLYRLYSKNQEVQYP